MQRRLNQEHVVPQQQIRLNEDHLMPQQQVGLDDEHLRPVQQQPPPPMQCINLYNMN